MMPKKSMELSKRIIEGEDMNKTPMPEFPDPLTQQANEAANIFLTNTEHVALNADAESGESLIRQIRGMAFVAGFIGGYLAASAAHQED